MPITIYKGCICKLHILDMMNLEAHLKSKHTSGVIA